MDRKKLKVLCLSFWTPPTVRPQSILIGKMIPEWINQGLKPVVLTYDVCGDWQIDLPIYKIPQFGVKKWQARVPGLVVLLEYFYYQKLFRVAKKIIKEHQINIVFSFANPQESNILGAMIANKLKVKFVAYFSDPWIDNPYKSYSEMRTWLVKKMEKYVVNHSDKVIFTNEQALELIMKKYSSEYRKRALVIPHCYNEANYPVVEKKSSKFVLSHIGAFYKERNPEILLIALQQILKNNPGLEKKLTLQLVGSINAYTGYSKEILNTMIAKHGLQNVAEIIPAISYAESLKYMKIADCLVVIDADFKNSPFFPSKVVDYAGSGKIIVGITPQDSPTALFLKHLGYQTFTHNESEPLTNYLKNLIDGTVWPVIHPDYLRKFNVKTTTANLIGLFEEVTKY